MNVNVKCFSTLVNAGKCDFSGNTSLDVSEGRTVADLAEALDIHQADVKLVFVNNRHAEMDTRLADGDSVGFAPAVGGM